MKTQSREELLTVEGKGQSSSLRNIRFQQLDKLEEETADGGNTDTEI